MDGGYRPKRRDTLRTVLQDAFRSKGHRHDVRIIETRCVGICPRKAVTALNANRPGKILTIPKGTETDEEMAQLMSEVEQ
jgi:predicted metal-binding protein